jgi:dihydroorotate dehydrogenase electron transfer subunit
MDTPNICKILTSVKETNDIKSFIFPYDAETMPGQFFMIWIPGIDEIPMSVSYIDKTKKGITFRRVGDATNALFEIKEGEPIGIRGPYGHGFEYTGKHLLFVGGGTGIAMIAPAVEFVRKQKKKVTCVLGTKTKDEMFFAERIQKTGANVILATDDGSIGKKGFASDIAIDIIHSEDIDSIYTCGPELMMKSLYDKSGTIPMQASLERYMKCGIGICGQCCVGEGIRVCVEGPIFKRETLGKLKDFGVSKRDASGTRILLK